MSKKFRKKQKIRYQKERAVLSDVLPYEVPIIFSNRYFYRFLLDNKVEIEDKTIKFNTDNNGIENIIELVFNVVNSNKLFTKLKKLQWSNEPTELTLKDFQHQLDEFIKKSNENWKFNHERNIPFTFKIAHKENDYRALSIIHPLNQLSVISFYDEYKESIKYYANQSQFSIRKPHKLAKHRYVNDYLQKLSKKEKDDKSAKIELAYKNEEHLKSFFAYERHSNIHGFFESYEYHRSEKKFNKLYKFDINKCFDSIYTHTIAWALLNKEIVKDNLNDNVLGATFAGKFDRLMQNMNYGETNGILIGSEVSRIFAEILLQKIDDNVQKSLFSNGIKHKIDYQVFRYVDDYFLLS